ncbi:MAG: B12-binding domain-containing radical SAM protein [Acidobacteriota bacterium]
MTPRALPVLAAVTPDEDYIESIRVIDEAVEEFPYQDIRRGDLVGISIQTANASYGYKLASRVRELGATVVFGGPHTSIFPEETLLHGHAAVTGDAEIVWAQVLKDYAAGNLQPKYKGGRVDPEAFTPARWDLMKLDRYLMASVQTVRGCPKQCSFCSVWVQDGRIPRLRTNDAIIEEVQQLYRAGFRTILFADDNFYPYTLQDIANARSEEERESLEAGMQNRLELLDRLATEVPDDMHFCTQITMEVADDPEYLAAMKRAKLVGALIGIEAVTPEGLKATNKEWNSTGDELVRKLDTIRRDGFPFILGSLIFGIESDTRQSLDYTIQFARSSGITMAQFIPLMPYPGTVDFALMKRGKKAIKLKDVDYAYWLDPDHPRILFEHPNMKEEELMQKVDKAWTSFYSIASILKRARRLGFTSPKKLLGYFVLSRGFLTRYRRFGLSADSAVRGGHPKLANLLGRIAMAILKRPPTDLNPPPTDLRRPPTDLRPSPAELKAPPDESAEAVAG